jgi:hypothetical protein
MPELASVTDSIRKTARNLFIVEVSAGMIGWLFGKDPALLMPIIYATLGALGVGELSNVGKRATTIPELMPEAKESS